MTAQKQERQLVFAERNRVLHALDECEDDGDPTTAAMLRGYLEYLNAQVDAFRLQDYESSQREKWTVDLAVDLAKANRQLHKVVTNILKRLRRS
jgi:hypothetical protein